jgi:hypothetical protein
MNLVELRAEEQPRCTTIEVAAPYMNEILLETLRYSPERID